jgi:hypothetical protein
MVGEVSVSRMIPADCMKVLSDALDEFKMMMDDNFVMNDFRVELSTSTNPSEGLQIVATLHPENADQFVLIIE